MFLQHFPEKEMIWGTLFTLTFLSFVEQSQGLQKTQSVFLLDDNLKQAAMDARRSQEITKRCYKKDSKATSKWQSQKYHNKSFLDNGKKGGQRYKRTSMQWRPPFNNSSNNNNIPSSNKQYHPGKKYHS